MTTLTEKWRALQQRLHALGYYDGPIDGDPGNGTAGGVGKALDKLAGFMTAPGGGGIPVTPKIVVDNTKPAPASASAIPASWMPRCTMKGIVAHWTGGSHDASENDKEHYHILWEADGAAVRGDHEISDNVSAADNDYAAHTRSCNTGFIGVSLCCMGGKEVREQPFVPGPFPMTETQWNAMTSGIAQLCKFYGIPVTPKTVLSHAEVQANLGKPQRGKWDFTRLAFDLSVKGAKACGDKMRAEVAAKLAKL